MSLWRPVLLSLLLLAVSACEKPDPFKVRLAVSRTPLSAPVLVADHLGFFRDAGLAVEISDVIGGHRSFAKVMDGEADMGTSSDTVIMFNAFKRDDFVNLATFVQSDNDIKILTRAAAGIRDVADLKGRRVAVTKGSASEYFFHTFLLFEGIDPAAVETLDMQPEALVEALASGRVDAISVWEPFAFQAVRRLQASVELLDTKGLYAITFNLVAGRGFADTHPAVAEGILHGLCRAVIYMAKHPAAAQAIVRRRLALNEDFIEWIWPDYLFRLSLSPSLLSTLESEARWAVAHGLVAGEQLPDFRRFSDPSALSRMEAGGCGL